jgi:hypothetical protein
MGFERAEGVGAEFAAAVELIHIGQQIPDRVRRISQQHADALEKSILITSAARQSVQPILGSARTFLMP